jgi:hypothetical protein
VYKVTSKTIEIRAFLAKENELVTIRDNFDLFISDKEVAKSVDAACFTYFNQNLIFVQEAKTVINGSVLENLSYVKNSEDKIANTIILSGDFELTYPSYSSNYYLFNLFTKELKKITRYFNLKNIFNSNEIICLTDGVKVNSYSAHEMQAIWQFDFTTLDTYQILQTKENKPYEVLKFLGVYLKELIVACSNGLILCLDIYTGIETRRFHNCDDYLLGSTTYHHFNDANVFVYDSENELLFALHTYYYMEIQLFTGSINITNLKEDMRLNYISFYSQKAGYAWDRNYIYTIANVANHDSHATKGDKCLLSVNRTTKKIEWKYIFENDSLNDIPQINSGKLYQLTANKELFVFEKGS